MKKQKLRKSIKEVWSFNLKKATTQIISYCWISIACIQVLSENIMSALVSLIDQNYPLISTIAPKRKRNKTKIQMKLT